MRLIKYENFCCDCASPGYPCDGDKCPNRNVPIFYCDECGEDFEKIYHYDDQELCIDCIEKRLDVVEVEE